MSEMRKFDCFGYNYKKCTCIPLNKLYCDEEECSFYKPRSEVDVKEISESIKKYAETHQ